MAEEANVVKMEAPEGVSAASVNSIEYKPTKEGYFEIAFQDVKHLLEHGFQLLKEAEEKIVEKVKGKK